MRRIVDLHPDDHTTRVELRTRLVTIREELGMTQHAFSEKYLGHGKGGSSSIGKLERVGVEQSKVSTIARWARILGYRLTLTPTGFPAPARWRRQNGGRAQLLARLVAADAVTGIGGADGWLAARTLHALTGIRIACGVTQAAVAQVQGITKESVSITEGGFADNQLVVLQRYARAVARASRYRSGYLAVGLDPIGAGQPEQASTHPASL